MITTHKCSPKTPSKRSAMNSASSSRKSQGSNFRESLRKSPKWMRKKKQIRRIPTRSFPLRVEPMTRLLARRLRPTKIKSHRRTIMKMRVASTRKQLKKIGNNNHFLKSTIHSKSNSSQLRKKQYLRWNESHHWRP